MCAHQGGQACAAAHLGSQPLRCQLVKQAAGRLRAIKGVVADAELCRSCVQMLKKRRPGEPLQAAGGALGGAKRPMMPGGMPPKGISALPSVPLVRLMRCPHRGGSGKLCVCACIVQLSWGVMRLRLPPPLPQPLHP